MSFIDTLDIMYIPFYAVCIKIFSVSSEKLAAMNGSLLEGEILT